MVGAFLGRIGDKIGPQKRLWLMAGTFLQALLTMAGAVAFYASAQTGLATDRSGPIWTNVLSFVGLAFVSGSLGLQGVLGKRMNTSFGTTSKWSLIWSNGFLMDSCFSRADHGLGRVDD
jgi:hypothetical protein